MPVAVRPSVVHPVLPGRPADTNSASLLSAVTYFSRFETHWHAGVPHDYSAVPVGWWPYALAMSQPDGPPMNRAARRRAARESRRAAGVSPDTPVPPAGSEDGEPYFMTIQHGPDRRNVSCRMITAKTVNPLTDTVTFSSVALEDTIHPVELAFEPPYVDLAANGGAKPQSVDRPR